MIYAKPAFALENDTQTPMGIWHANRSRNLGQKTRPYSNKKNRELVKLSILLSRHTTE